MKYKIICLICFLFFLCASAEAGEIREIELTDGSLISAEIVSFTNGVYTLKSDTMGTLKIKDSKIREIRMKSGAGAGNAFSSESVSREDVQALQQSIMGNQGIMSMILGLQNDPEIQKILQNPAIMEAVNSGNIGALMSNPDFIKLMENQKIKGITNQLGK